VSSNRHPTTGSPTTTSRRRRRRRINDAPGATATAPAAARGGAGHTAITPTRSQDDGHTSSRTKVVPSRRRKQQLLQHINYLNFIPGIETIAWESLRWAHGRADLTLVTSPQMKEELQAQGIPRVDVLRKGIDTE
jgi:hypothetical protein